jgi:acyl dehydratase
MTDVALFPQRADDADVEPDGFGREAMLRAEALIGRPLRRRANRTAASHDTLIGYARAIGSRIPLYLGPSAGMDTYYGRLVGHPTSLYCFDDTFVAPSFPGVHAIYAGCDWTWHYPIRLGSTITTTARLTGLTPKHGSFCGDMVLQDGLVEYRDELGRLVAEARPKVLRTPRPSARAAGKYAGVEPYEYSAAELDAVMAGYRAEAVRGSRPLYWEDVEIGDELPPIVRGPLTTEDVGMYVGAIRQTLFYGDFVDHARRHPADVFWDPETGLPDWWDASLLRDVVAHSFGFGLAHDAGQQRVAWLENCVSNWVGDYGLVTSLSARIEAPNYRGDTTWIAGRVTDKRIVGEPPAQRFEVEYELVARNERGERTASATGTVHTVSHRVDTIPPALELPVHYDPFRGLP